MVFDIVKIPKKITPSPIVEAILELRFEADVPADALLGMLYPGFTNKFPKLEKLSILQLPEPIRESDPALKFSPHYRLSNEEFLLQIGPQAISVICPNEYKGWDRFFNEIKDSFDEIFKLKIIKKPIRIGLRYIDFFADMDIFPKLKIDLKLGQKSLIGENNILRTEFSSDGFRNVLQIANKAKMKKKVSGSTIDIDVIFEDSSKITADFNALVDKAHNCSKRLFFGILEEEFLNTFNPEY